MPQWLAAKIGKVRPRMMAFGIPSVSAAPLSAGPLALHPHPYDDVLLPSSRPWLWWAGPGSMMQNDATTRFGRWTFGEENESNGTCSRGNTVFIVSGHPSLPIKDYADCAALLYLDGEDFDALDISRQLDHGDPGQLLKLLYLGTFLGSSGPTPPLSAQLLPLESTGGRRVGQLFWPFAFLSNLERLPSSLNLGELLDVPAALRQSKRRLAPLGPKSISRPGLVAFMSQRCRPPGHPLRG